VQPRAKVVDARLPQHSGHDEISPYWIGKVREVGLDNVCLRLWGACEGTIDIALIRCAHCSKSRRQESHVGNDLRSSGAYSRVE
jgi:hypothetical protein